ncbi:MAG: HDOD domain-containing protein [Leptospiraceae bacterium]|nr:HDOD domain-containing protein [Leptospiraceae bacterium]MCP5502546.1 HDOD domain-containing protein [Leptospiraceae bacterium]
MKEQIDTVVRDINKLPPMSNVVIRVMNLVRDPAVSIQELATEILKDPAITASILKLSNSAYYRASKPIRTVQEALMTLGIKTVKEIIILTASKAILNKELKGYQLEGDALWLQSLVVAELSSRIAREKGLNVEKDLIFTAGLLHGIGKVILSQFFPGVMFKIRNELKADNTLKFTEIEKKYFGYTYAEVGKIALDTWNFPDELKEAVAYHLEPEKAKGYPLIASVVHVSHTISIVSGIGIDIGGIYQELSPFALKLTKVTESDLEKFYLSMPELEKSINDLRNP